MFARQGHDMVSVRPIRRPGFSLIEALVVVAIISVLVGLTLAGVQRVRSSAARAQCQNNLRQIGLGLANYHAAHGRLPVGVTKTPEPDSFPLMSWHTRLLPFVEQDPVWRQAVEAALTHPQKFSDDPPHPFTTVIPIYGCPADARVRQPVMARNRLRVALTSYLGVDGTRHTRRDGVLFRDSKVRFADITDGTSNTLMVGERPPSPDMWVGWWYAGYGVDFNGTADLVLGARERNSVRDPEFPDCGQGFAHFKPGRFDSICDVMHFWSPHPTGANFLFADGSVRFLGYSADDILPALATRAGGEAVTLPE
jgi:prepilin-type N-terminal cleavage/methylation domain-containing protein/prepilin-type processing-associated H-X9-DG protein